MTFHIGRTVLYRDFRADGRMVLVMPQQVISDDERGLLTWQPIGTQYLVRQTTDGRTRRDVDFGECGWEAVDWVLGPATWESLHVLRLARPGRAHSVWWMFSPDGSLACWYVNLEAPSVRWDDGATAGNDTVDQALDIVVGPDRSWRWKDEDEFSECTGHPSYWDAAQAELIRAEGEAVVRDIKAGVFPFDGTWSHHMPEPVPADLPAEGWDRPCTLPPPVGRSIPPARPEKTTRP